jgi:hypothetical protein
MRERINEMAGMTPEQEAARALDLGLSRSDLSMGGQLAYDRLRQEREAAALRDPVEATRQRAAAAARQAAEDAERLAVEEAAAQIAAIPMTTADSLPPVFSGSQVVQRMKIVEFCGYENPAMAEDALRVWVYNNNYNAVIGIRILPLPSVIGSTVANGLASGTRTEFSWGIYGTAIGWSNQGSE